LETAVAGAKVTLTKTNPDKAKTVFTGTTNSDGDANFVLPSSSPGTLLTFTAEKTGYFADPLEKEIAKATVEFDPASLSAELTVGKTTEQYFDEKITNKTGAEFSIDSIRLPGKIARLLDTAAMLNYSSKGTGRELSGGRKLLDYAS